MALQDLQEAFAELEFRASRLREWADLDKTLRSLEESFKALSDDAQGVYDGRPVIPQGTFQRLRQVWSRCRRTDLADLDALNKGFLHISRASRTNPSKDGSSLTVVQLDEMLKLIKTIESTLNGVSIDKLYENCSQFARLLEGVVAVTKLALRRELAELCAMTSELRRQI